MPQLKESKKKREAQASLQTSYNMAKITKFKINKPVATHKIGWISLDFPVATLTKQ